MDEEEVIEGFDAKPLDDAVCPVGGGHQFVLSGRYYHRITGKLTEHITCVKCGLISVGWYHSPPADIIEGDWEEVE